MGNPISYLERSKKSLVECGILLQHIHTDVGGLQDSLDLDSLLLNLVLPDQATPEMREAIRQIRASAQLASRRVDNIATKLSAINNGLLEALTAVLQGLENCDPLLGLPNAVRLLEAPNGSRK